MPVCASRSFKTYIGSDNRVTETAATVTARTEADDSAGVVTLFDASNLEKDKLLPQYRTEDRALELDGVNDYAWVADHADFDIVGDLTIECLVRPGSVVGRQNLLDKIVAADGYRITLEGDEFRMSIDGVANHETTTAANLLVGAWYRLKAVYEAAAQTVTLYVNGVLEASATGGVIPAAITANASRVTIGADGANANKLTGEIGFIGLDNALHNHGGYLALGDSVSYWSMDSALVGGDIPDDQAAHDLTVVSIDATNFTWITTHAWINVLNNDDTADPTLLFIDRRHNLTSAATITLLSNLPTGSWPVISAGNAVTAGEPFIIRDTGGLGAVTSNWAIEINDPTNTADFISIPYMYIGSHTEFANTSIGDGLQFGTPRTNTQILTSVGNIITLVKSDPYRVIAGQLPDLTGTDLTAIEEAIDAALQGKPIIFGYDIDDEGEHTRAMYWLNALELRELFKAKTPLAAEHWRRSIALQELIAPAGYVG